MMTRRNRYWMPRWICLVCAVGCVVASEPEQPVFDEQTDCVFTDIAGVWGRGDPARDWAFEMSLHSGFDREIVGWNRIYSDESERCVFDVRCVRSQVDGYDYVFNATVQDNGGCLSGGYHLRLDGDALEVTYGMRLRPDQLGDETTLWQRAD